MVVENNFFKYSSDSEPLNITLEKIYNFIGKKFSKFNPPVHEYIYRANIPNIWTHINKPIIYIVVFIK